MAGRPAGPCRPGSGRLAGLVGRPGGGTRPRGRPVGPRVRARVRSRDGSRDWLGRDPSGAGAPARRGRPVRSRGLPDCRLLRRRRRLRGTALSRVPAGQRRPRRASSLAPATSRTPTPWRWPG
ncbi:hypothetical protein BRD17_03970 [Halobacteriales archaeon SW_7_68_16]|nr:MAG: hypothetical protein BRD17_03970 [Halobacteriales archaeon SW_7_68_16]